MNQYLLFALSFTPIVSLAVLSIWKNVKIAAIISFLITTILFFVWNNSVSNFIATLFSALVSTINILMIVFGAIFLYNLMDRSGRIMKIKESLYQIHPSKDVLFFFVTLSLTGFFEGVAGFGTPGAIVPPILITLGFNPLVSVVSVLLFDSLFSAFGAVGTPLFTGMQPTISLPASSYKAIAFISSIMLSLAGTIFLLFTTRMYQTEYGTPANRTRICLMYLFFVLPFVCFSWFATELSTILSSLIMILMSVLFFSKNRRKLDIAPWYPYIILVILLVLPKIIPDLNELLDYEVQFLNILDSGKSASIKPLKSPLFPFLIAGAWVMNSDSKIEISFYPIFKTSLNVFSILFPVISLSLMMLAPGIGFPSMVNLISQAFASTGNLYPLVSAYVGMLGSFITGSTTVSNVVFSASQLEVANILGFDNQVVLSLQHCGAALGNAICLFNIIAACSVAGIKEEAQILKQTSKPTLLAGLVVGVCGILLL